MASSSMLHVRIDDDLKREATAALTGMGLSTADAVRLLFKRVVAEQAFPLELKVPNAATRAAMAETDRTLKAGAARFESADQLFTALEQEQQR